MCFKAAEPLYQHIKPTHSIIVDINVNIVIAVHNICRLPLWLPGCFYQIEKIINYKHKQNESPDIQMIFSGEMSANAIQIHNLNS